MIKTGAGILDLSQTNSYTGQTLVEAGTLKLTRLGRIAESSAVIVNGTFDTSGADSAKIKNLSGSGQVNIGNKSLAITNANGIFSGTFNGTSAIQLEGGTQILTGENTSAVSASITSGATLQIGNGGTAGSFAGDITNYGAVVFNRSDNTVYGGVITANGSFAQVGSGTLILTGNSSTRGNVTIGTGSTLQIGNGGASGWIGGGNGFAGSIANNGSLIYNRSASETYSGVISGSGSVTQAGTSELSLRGANTYHGDTIITGGGSVNVTADNNLGQGGITLNNGKLTAQASFSTNKYITLAGNGTINTLGSSVLSLGNAISGAGGLTKEGDGKLELKARSTYTGQTVINSGTLALSGQGSVASSSGVVVNSTFDVSGVTGTQVKSLSGSGQVTLGGASFQINDASGVFSGRFNGTGTVSVMGGTQVLTGDNTAATSFSTGANGVLQIGNGGAGGSVTGNITNVGAVVFNRSDTTVYGGVITANGSFAQTGSGTLILTGNSSTRGNVTIGTGSTLQIGNGGASGWIGGGNGFAGSIANSGTLAYSRSDKVVFTGNISGSGSVNLLGSGNVIFTGANSYTGNTNIMNGLLTVDGSVAHSALTTIHSGAKLGGTGTLGNTVIASGATHTPGNSIGTQTIAGNYTNAGILQIEGTPTITDRLNVTGDVDITGATLDLVLSPANAANWQVVNGPFTLINKQSAGAVTGQFASIRNNLVFLDPTVNYAGGDGNDVSLKLQRNDIKFASLGRNFNQIAVANALDGLPHSSDLWLAMAMTSNADVARTALTQLSGDVHASLPVVLIEDSRFLREAANDRLRQAAKTVGGDATSVATGNTDANSGITVWGQGFGSWGVWDATSNNAKMDRSVGGMFIGADTTFNNWQLGVLAGYSHSSVDLKDMPSSAKADNYHLGLYAGTQWDAVAFRTGLAHTWNDIETSRSVNFPGFSDSLDGDYRAGTTQVFGELGYGISAGAYQFEPFANLSYVHINRRSFSEAGGQAALSVGSQSLDTTFTTLGLRAETVFDLGGVSTKARGTLGWKHAFGDTDTLSSQAFSGGSVFDISGMSVAKDVAVVEAGLDFALTKNATFGLLYSGQLASKAKDQSFKATLAVKF
ncbi:autotransporter domain-containing protein [Pseudochrobactrum sp. sp1633]|uniref:autotransporter domain-containing protein n=1 Tax=Pseudochrobactrum sp. sp1633 TaxID=3036706 RepID=UPI0025A61387|nr:autotransporter domain-containing protein [Pseudochrobactrum sp. sp1633]MDM8347084.1 autotransporter domain-containing protein [Pseudochrobactrum sp. sp1633]HWD12613.1 autotransporter domain-containing protein [Pseudochrobactrum sp.]